MEQGRRLIAGRSVRWDEERAQRAYRDGCWSRETLADALARAAAETPDRIALVDGERRIDCETLSREAASLARALLARTEPGSVVSFMLPNWAEAATIYLGATLAGMVAHPILPSLRERELLHMLPDVGSRLLFIPERIRNQDYSKMLADVCGRLRRPPEVVVVRGAPGSHCAYEALMAETHDGALPALDPDAVRLILYTSGTSGSPKGVMHSHNSIHALVRQLGENWLTEPGDCFLVPSPISHIGGSIYAFEFPLLLRTTAVLMERWDADAAIELMERHRCTHMAGATPFLEQLLSAAAARGTRLPALKLFICGGAAVPPALIRQAASYLENAVVTRVYGSTEVPVTTVGTLDRADLDHAAETDGVPGIAQVRLTPHDAGRSGEGEICARGPQMLVGYVHRADEASVFDADGYYRTGDLGRWVDGRFLLVSGRAKDIIIRKGENISPKEVEDVLLEHPGIDEVAVVGIPDRLSGEIACAVIVSQADPRPDLASVSAFLAEQGIAAFKRPERVVLWAALPRNATGKILKHEIRAALAATEDED
ncbi:AMP-binding protein [Sandaracinobacter sp. RS1-74]|uniref:AMP-binding protein n=1 Tax=Sandaracinobacteroides sayramensis TaxID=2913411 RepID=UPI001EDB4670|nr:AMP-binding protein [Sandaracinobacteroides sayramensis]MCG2842025.1 AMP-binding protein [Sandaracinobacteroides sayramensis]